jgi:hypothetical protein
MRNFGVWVEEVIFLWLCGPEVVDSFAFFSFFFE